MNTHVHAAALEMEANRLPDWKLSYRVDEACAATGYGKTKMWELIRDRKIAAKKDGGVTLILRPVLQSHINEVVMATQAPDVVPEKQRRIISPESNREGFIYFARFGTDGPIKIGFACNVTRRIYQLQNAAPEEIHLICSIPGCLQVEANLHHRFRRARLRGEWFEPVKKLLAFIEGVGK